MDLNSYLSKIGKTVDDVQKIYHGLDHCCRCGCGGNYFDRGSRGFTRAMNKMLSAEFKPLEVGMDVHTRDGRYLQSTGVEIDGVFNVYVNIPYNGMTDKCYCLYFEK